MLSKLEITIREIQNQCSLLCDFTQSINETINRHYSSHEMERFPSKEQLVDNLNQIRQLLDKQLISLENQLIQQK